MSPFWLDLLDWLSVIYFFHKIIKMDTTWILGKICHTFIFIYNIYICDVFQIQDLERLGLEQERDSDRDAILVNVESLRQKLARYGVFTFKTFQGNVTLFRFRLHRTSKSVFKDIILWLWFIWHIIWSIKVTTVTFYRLPTQIDDRWAQETWMKEIVKQVDAMWDKK